MAQKNNENLVGCVFDRLTVIGRSDDYISPRGHHRPRYLCECNCGNIVTVNRDELKSGKTKSCGCLRKERAAMLGRNKHKLNSYDLSGEFGIGIASNSSDKFYFDLEDYDKIKDICWIVHCSGRSKMKKLCGRDCISGKSVHMHELLGFKNYDHIDRNELNNRKSNFRKCTQKENTRNRSLHRNNTSGIIGVSFHSRDRVWRSNIMVDGKNIHLGCFVDKDEAIRSRLLAEQKYYGEFAPQRHLFEVYLKNN